MAISRDEGDQRYGLDCWEDADAAGAPESFFSDESLELVLEAHRLIANRDFQYIELCERRPGEFDGWYRIIRFSVPDQAAEAPAEAAAAAPE